VKINFKRYYVPNAIVFITQVVHARKPVFANADHLELLRKTLRQVKVLYPFKMWGYVFLPDHFHLLPYFCANRARFYYLPEIKRE